jgi:hypothetical protein
VSGSTASGALLLRIAVLLLGLAAIDTLMMGACAAGWPAALFTFLEVPGSPDGLWLCWALGCLLLTQAAALLVAALWPARQGALVLFPLSGRALLCGIWLWLLGVDRITLPAGRLRLLLVHDAIWLLVFILFLLVRRSASASSKTTKDAVPCLDSSAQ